MLLIGVFVLQRLLSDTIYETEHIKQNTYKINFRFLKESFIVYSDEVLLEYVLRKNIKENVKSIRLQNFT